MITSKSKFITRVTAFILIVMSINYIPIDTREGVSTLKVGVMALSPIIMLLFTPKISRALVWGGLCILTAYFFASQHIESFRASTVIYMSLFILTFSTYFNLIYAERAFNIDFFISFIKRFIAISTIVLLVQQAFIIVGIKQFELINLSQVLDRGIGANSLFAEPSTFARIMAVLFLALLRMYELKWGANNVTIKSIYANSKWTVLGFLWCMITMGSGTAFIALGLISIYFIKRKYILIAIPVLIAAYYTAIKIEFEPLQRALVAFEATTTLDNETIQDADGSAAFRIVPLINTVTRLDITKKETWFGTGIDTIDADDYFNKNKMIGGINDYGLIYFILTLILIYSCCIKSIFSIESAMYIILIQATTPNIPYAWGIFMIWTTVRYFQRYYKPNTL